MIFEYPYLLLLLVIPVGMMIWQVRSKISGSTLSLGKIKTRGILPSSRRKILFSVGTFFLVFALARPQWGVRDEQVFDQSREVIIAVDLSRSMLASDLSPSRLDRAKIMIEGLLQELKGERVGLLLFAGTAYLQSPLSPDYEIIKELIPSLTPDWMPQGGTDYTQMLQTASDAFEAGQAADRFLIVLSDGESTTVGWESEANKLKESGIRVIGLGVGTLDGSVIPAKNGGYIKDERGAVVMSKLEPRTLQELAMMTQGVYRDAAQWVDLHLLVQETVDQGKQGEFQEKRRERKVERFQWFLGLAVLCLLMSFAFEMPARIQPRPMRVASVIGLLFGLTLLEGFSQEDPNTLHQEVARLSAQSKVLPQEWAELADKTIQKGKRTPEFPEGAVQDALAGVSKGEKQDAKAADWKKLRSELENLLQSKNKEKKSQNQDQKSKDSDSKNDSKDSQDSSSNQKDQEQKQNEDQRKENPSQNPEKNSSSPKNQSPENPQAGKQNPEQKKESESSKENNEKKNSSEKPDDKNEGQSGEKPKQQKVGGQKRDLAGQKAEGISKEKLMQLNQVKENDSPATLFQVLEGKSKAHEQKGKDW